MTKRRYTSHHRTALTCQHENSWHLWPDFTTRPRPCPSSSTSELSSPTQVRGSCRQTTQPQATRPQLAPFKRVSAADEHQGSSPGVPVRGPIRPFTQAPTNAYCQNGAISAHAHAGKAGCLPPPTTSCDLASHAHTPPPLPPTPQLLAPLLTPQRPCSFLPPVPTPHGRPTTRQVNLRYTAATNSSVHL